MPSELDGLDAVERHFHAALERDSSRRAEYLERQVPAALRPQVERLLSADEDTLARPELSPWPPGSGSGPGDGATLRAGDAVGPYVIIDRLGEGGFGVVYRAEQREPLDRQVALKIIRPGLSSRDVLARFDAERQALALMDHPSIARVLDAGATADGAPYFAMELVRGSTVTHHASRNGLDLRRRLDLFLDICRGLQHAHQKGVVHRDLKPSNVLVQTAVDGEVTPKVIDFGIAKALSGRLTDRTLDSARYRVLGTPAYMSPEQARGDLDIDTRSDVYALGALLYELVGGEPPFSSDRLASLGFSEVLRTVIEVEPPPPSTRSIGLPRELDWIVGKAMAKERGRRYASASELAADIERFLAGEAVLAGPVSRGYRLRKLIARHRLPVALAGLLLVALLAGIAGTGLGLLEASKQRDLARLETSRARAATDFLVETVALA
ncbi:MAG: serine/threonine-protein kinase, partial [Acidobacteriota bacterium]